MKAIEFNIYDIVKDVDYDAEVYSLTPELYEKAITIGKEFDRVKLTIDIMSKFGMNVSIVDGISTYIIRYEDVQLTPVFDPDAPCVVIGFAVLNGVHYDSSTNKASIDVCEFIRPLKYVDELQMLLRLSGYKDFANSLKI